MPHSFLHGVEVVVFRVVQRHYPAFRDMIRFQITTRAEFDRMAETLATIKGRFLLSLNDRPEVRETFARFDQKPVATRYSVKAAGVRELVEARLSQ